MKIDAYQIYRQRNTKKNQHSNKQSDWSNKNALKCVFYFEYIEQFSSRLFCKQYRVVCLFLVSILVQGIKKFRFSQISIKSAAHISLKLISFQLKLSINIFQNVIDCWMHAIDGFQTILSHLTKFRIFILILNSLRKIKMNHATRLCVRCLQGI